MNEQQLKISGPGWLCVFDGGEWIAVFKLTPDQMEQWRVMRPHDVNALKTADQYVTSDVTDEALRKLWVDAGGEFARDGARERGRMKVERLLPLLRSLGSVKSAGAPSDGR